MKSISKVYKIVMALIELLLAVPILGGAIIVSSGWSMLWLLFILHGIGIYLASREHKRKAIHIVGLILVPLEFIPVIGWLCHLIIGIMLLIDGIVSK